MAEDEAGRARDLFESSLARLNADAKRFAELDKSPENIDEVLAARTELDRQRKAVGIAKKRVASRYEYQTPDFVETRFGAQDTSTRARLLATVGVLAMVATLGVAGFFVIGFFAGSDFDVEVIDERLVAGTRDEVEICRWEIDATVSNAPESDLTVDRVRVVLDRRWRTLTVSGQDGAVGPGQTATLRLETVLAMPETGRCPGPDLVQHAELEVSLANANASKTHTATARF